MKSGFVEPRPVDVDGDELRALVLSRVRRRARAPDRQGVRAGAAADPDLLAGADLRLRSWPRSARSPRKGRSTSPGCVDQTQVEKCSSSGGRTASRPGRSRCSRRCSRERSSRASARRRDTPTSVHDYMHAKVTVADDTVFCGRSTSRGPASGTPRTCSRSTTPKIATNWPRSSTRCARATRRSRAAAVAGTVPRT